ncbi:MAG TPA: M56 family metallopeptidase [Terracidiphilus sp.]|jgi:beta-lactamase regulating signal transducer with metallopeptidase domain|nr:M56 family metallopeptidase [Terracidiphilus sp.]
MYLSQIIDVVRQTLVLAVPPLINAFQSFSHAAAPLAVTALWQGMAVASCLAICLRFVPRISAQHRFLLWSIGCAALVSLPFLSLLANHSAFAIAPDASSKMTNTAVQPWLQLDQRWSVLIASLWIVASAVLAIDLVLHSLRLRKLWTRAVLVEAHISAADSPIASGVFRRRTAQICTTHDLDRPSVIGFFAPRILIPDWLFARLAPAELDQIVLHESEHLRRFDDWTNLLQKLCLILFPLSPALWWIERQLSKDREMACDEAVVRITQAPRAYAACLASLAERGLERRAEALSLGAWHRRSELVHRVHSILRNRRGLSPIAARALLGAVGCCLLAATVELARCPQFVAFAPSAQAGSTAQAIGNQSAQLGDAVYSANPHQMLTPGAHAILAKAEMPTAPFVKRFANRARLQDLNPKAPAVGEVRAASSEPRISESSTRSHEVHALVARKPDSPADAAPQQWIVFTAWEQVETSDSAATQTTADYDTNPTAETSAANENTSATPSTASTGTVPAKTDASISTSNATKNRTIFTRLIFRVVPQGSKSLQSTAIPIGDGWLVIQL